jgi:hypothetical protein
MPVIALTDHAATKGVVEQTSLDTSSTDRANRRLIDASTYPSSERLEGVSPTWKAKLRARRIEPAEESGDPEPAERNNGPADVAERRDFPFHMYGDLTADFVGRYHNDTEYSVITKDVKGNGETVDRFFFSFFSFSFFFRPGLPFVLPDGLLYNIHPDGTRALSIPHSLTRCCSWLTAGSIASASTACSTT